MSYLLDTNVLSETRKRNRNPSVTEWLSVTIQERMHVSVLTIGEIGHGITQLRARGDHRQAAVFERWLADVIHGFGRRIVPVTLEIAREWGAQSKVQPIPVIDALIAATAKVHGWTLVTRNVKDFDSTGVRVLNPCTG
ncbi:MAG: type II toxin-antitoxin system VapC family toxin [Pseudonocardiaceae bacterium]